MTVTESTHYSSSPMSEDIVFALCGEATESHRAGDAAQALEFLTDAFRISYRLNNPRLTGYVLTEMGSTYLTLAEVERAADCFNTALKMDSTRCPEVRLSAYTGLARIDCSQGNIPSAVNQYNAAIAAAREGAQPTAEAALLNDLADLHAGANRHRDALNAYQRAIDAAQSARTAEAEVHAHIGAAQMAAHLRSTDQVSAHCDQALLAMRRVQNRLLIRALRNKLAALLEDVGHPRQIIDLEFALADAYSTGHITEAVDAHANLAQSLADQGDHDQALVHLETARSLAQQLFDRITEGRIVIQIAHLYESSGMSYLALRLYDEWAHTAREAGDREAEMAALEHLAAAHDRVGQPEKGIEALQRAALLANSKCDRRLEAAYLLEQAMMHLKTRSGAAATEALERAKKILPPGSDPALQNDITAKLAEIKPRINSGSLSGRLSRG